VGKSQVPENNRNARKLLVPYVASKVQKKNCKKSLIQNYFDQTRLVGRSEEDGLCKAHFNVKAFLRTVSLPLLFFQGIFSSTWFVMFLFAKHTKFDCLSQLLIMLELFASNANK